MPKVPTNPCIYHIVHVDRLASIVSDGGLWCDAKISAEGRPGSTIGMGNIKYRRGHELQVSCWPGDYVGEYVPFYFGPRSVMLYLIHRRNAELSYQGGQSAIVHLEASLSEVIDWANDHGRRWAFSLSNAGAYGTEFRNKREELHEINWEAVAANSWSAPATKHAKQAEFLLKQKMPWSLCRRIGVLTPSLAQQVADTLRAVPHRPEVRIMPAWYY